MLRAEAHLREERGVFARSMRHRLGLAPHGFRFYITPLHRQPGERVYPCLRLIVSCMI